MPRTSAPLLLLDTHVWYGMLEGEDALVSPAARDAVDRAARAGRLRVSAISVWEIGMLESKKRIAFAKDCLTWVTEALAVPGIALVPLSPEIAIASSRLPGAFHADPADRIIVATARVLGATLLTRDANILAYGRSSHLSVSCA